MRRLITALTLAATMVLGTTAAAVAGPTCEGSWTHHGEHVTSDYAQAGEPGARGGPAHFGSGFTPGATFCGPGDNQAPPLLGEPGRF